MTILEIIACWIAFGSIVVITCLQIKSLRDKYYDVIINSNLYLTAGNFAHVAGFITLCVIWPNVLIKAVREWIDD